MLALLDHHTRDTTVLKTILFFYLKDRGQDRKPEEDRGNYNSGLYSGSHCEGQRIYTVTVIT